jgi:choline dehydrogenase
VLRRGDTAPTIVHARRGVVLSAGAIGSPHLLQLSGIGPAAVLAAAGVHVALDRRGVGANLQDHLQIRRVFDVSGTVTLNTRAASWRGRAAMALEYALARTGPLSMAPSQLGAFARSGPARAHPNVQFHVQPLSLDAFGEPLHAADAITASVCNLNPTSRGTVALACADPAAAPRIAPNYLATAEDRAVAVESVRLARRIARAPALAPFRPVERYPRGFQHQHEHDDADDADAALAAASATTIFHPVGTTAMGRDGDADAVADARLRVRCNDAGGVVHGLRVADAGVMPTITSGNTNSPTLMIAEKAARWILADD